MSSSLKSTIRKYGVELYKRYKNGECVIASKDDKKIIICSDNLQKLKKNECLVLVDEQFQKILICDCGKLQ